jgi:hypothetical protein
MSIGGRCCAPTPNKTRCSNATVRPEAMHCSVHYKDGLKSYTQYKELCKVADRYSITEANDISSLNGKIRFLNICYKVYIAAYNARLEYRNAFVVCECYDYGHDKQFTLLNEKMDTCEILLTQLHDEIKASSTQEKEKKFSSTSSTKEEVEDSSPKEVEEVEEKVEITIEAVKSFREKRLKDERETKKIIAAYIKENKKLLKQKRNLVEVICSKYRQIALFEGNKFIYEELVAIVIITAEFHRVMKYEDEKLRLLTKASPSCDKTIGFSLGCSAITRFSDIRDFLMDRDINFILLLLAIPAQYPDLFTGIIFKFLEVWEKTTFSPTTSILKIKIRKTDFDFAILDLSTAK